MNEASLFIILLIFRRLTCVVIVSGAWTRRWTRLSCVHFTTTFLAILRTLRSIVVVGILGACILLWVTMWHFIGAIKAVWRSLIIFTLVYIGEIFNKLFSKQVFSIWRFYCFASTLVITFLFITMGLGRWRCCCGLMRRVWATRRWNKAAVLMPASSTSHNIFSTWWLPCLMFTTARRWRRRRWRSRTHSSLTRTCLGRFAASNLSTTAVTRHTSTLGL